MDFASLKEEIAKNKRALENVTDTSKKYIRRGDLEKQRETSYLQAQAQLEAERLAKQEEKLKKVIHIKDLYSLSLTFILFLFLHLHAHVHVLAVFWMFIMSLD